MAPLIPTLEKIRGGRDKGLMREAMKPYLPARILAREKQGFGAPLVHWLSEPLKDLVAQLSSRRARIREVVDDAALRAMLDGATRNLRTDWRAPLRLWTLVMLEQWLENHAAPSVR